MIDEKNRLDYIDAVKGIGILLVVLGHNLQGVPSVTSWIYSFHMPLFFIVTGYLEAHKRAHETIEKPISEYICGKALTLLWPYLTFSILNLIWLVVFQLAMGVQLEDPFPIILLKMTTTYGYRALWFLPAMFLASVIHRIAGTKAPAATLVLSILLGSSASLVLEHTAADFLLRYPIIYFGRIAIGVSFICIGKKVYGLLGHVHGAGIPVLTVVCLAITLLFPLIPDAGMAFARMQNIPLYYLLGCAGTIGLLLLTRNCPVCFANNSFFSFLSKNSLIIMALHMDFPIEIAWMILGKTGLGSHLSLQAASGLAVLQEMIILTVSIFLIQRYFSFLLKMPKRKVVR